MIWRGPKQFFQFALLLNLFLCSLLTFFFHWFVQLNLYFFHISVKVDKHVSSQTTSISEKSISDNAYPKFIIKIFQISTILKANCEGYGKTFQTSNWVNKSISNCYYFLQTTNPIVDVSFIGFWWNKMCCYTTLFYFNNLT